MSTASVLARALKREHGICPDFRHASDLEASGRVVGFLTASAPDALSLRGGPGAIAERLVEVLGSAALAFD